MNEIWREVVGYENLYKVSNLGSVKSLNYRRSGKEGLLKPCLNNGGYLVVSLCRNRKQKIMLVHLLVAEAFLDHTPCGFKLVVDHKNQVRNDCRLDNLRIVTARVNADKKHIKSSSKYTGVSWSKKNNNWMSMIQINGKSKYLGSFDSEIEASEYYEKALYNHLNGLLIEVKIPNFTSKYKGVSWHKRDKIWGASIKINGKTKYLGSFQTELEAHNAYQTALIALVSNK